MATSVDETEHLECTVCLERFQEPKVLRCQHMYCKKCLERLVTRIGQGHYAITCPECRENTEVSNGDVMSLPSNYVINRLLSKRSISSQSCTKHDGEILKLFCQTCDELICRDCAIIDIDKQIELLEKKRQSLKDELQKSVLSQKNNIHEQMGTFVSSLDYLKNNAESIAQNLSKGSEVEVSSTKNRMIQQLTKINSATANLKPRGRITYDLEADPALDENTVGKMAKIRQYDKEAKIGQYDKAEYKLTIVRGSCFVERRAEQELLRSTRTKSSKFYIRPKCKNTIFSPDNKVQVNIKSPSSKVYSPDISKKQDGSFSFSHLPNLRGDYKIEIIINGSPIHGSPFTWEVTMRW